MQKASAAAARALLPDSVLEATVESLLDRARVQERDRAKTARTLRSYLRGGRLDAFDDVGPAVDAVGEAFAIGEAFGIVPPTRHRAGYALAVALRGLAQGGSLDAVAEDVRAARGVTKLDIAEFLAAEREELEALDAEQEQRAAAAAETAVGAWARDPTAAPPEVRSAPRRPPAPPARAEECGAHALRVRERARTFRGPLEAGPDREERPPGGGRHAPRLRRAETTQPEAVRDLV